MDGYVSKPIDRARLAEALNSVLGASFSAAGDLASLASVCNER